MHIRRIAVKNFRKLNDVEIGHLEKGLTVIVGENEEGKSTMLKALQAAFFERFNLSKKASTEMLPFGSIVRPEIEVDFEVNNATYHLNKCFRPSPSALLESNNQKWQNDAAEEKLREILGFTPPKQGATSSKHRGLSGLLWVEQGRAYSPLEFNPDTLSSIHEAIEGEIGQVTGGERGRKLLEAVELRFKENFTPKGREKQPLKEARAEVEALRADVHELENKLSQYEGKVDRLESLSEKLNRYEKENVLARAETEAEKAANAEKKLAETENKCETASAELEVAKKSLEITQGERSGRDVKIKQLEKLESEILEIEKLLERSEEERNEATQSHRLSEERLKNARKDSERTRREWIVAQRKLKRAETLSARDNLTERLDKAQSVQEKIDDFGKLAAAIPIDKRTMASLKKMDGDLAKKRAALEAIATTIEFLPREGRLVTVDNEVVDVADLYRIKERTSLDLEGFGELVVTPGGEDIRHSRAAVENLQSDLKSSLDTLGYSSIGEAEEDFRKKNELLIEIEISQSHLDGIVPEGLEELESNIKARRGELASLTVGEGEPSLSVETARELEERARSAEEESEKTRIQEERTVEAENKKLSAINEEWIESRTALQIKRRERESLEKDIKAGRASNSDEQLKEELRKAERQRDERERALNELEEQLDAMSPEFIRSERERTQEVLSNLKQQISKEQQQAHDIKIELRMIGQTGLGETLEEKRSEFTQAEQRLERKEKDASAWRLLKETLEEAERGAKETFIAPVKERLQPYMRYVLPHTSLNLNADSLAIDSLQRDGQEEPFQALSMGTREQIAVLARLALAEILLEDNKPVAIILDDPLVNSDDRRFKLMTAALRNAAKKMQILILTCHEQRYLTLGTTMVQLQDCYKD